MISDRMLAKTDKTILSAQDAKKLADEVHISSSIRDMYAEHGPSSILQLSRKRSRKDHASQPMVSFLDRSAKLKLMETIGAFENQISSLSQTAQLTMLELLCEEKYGNQVEEEDNEGVENGPVDNSAEKVTDEEGALRDLEDEFQVEDLEEEEDLEEVHVFRRDKSRRKAALEQVSKKDKQEEVSHPRTRKRVKSMQAAQDEEEEEEKETLPPRKARSKSKPIIEDETEEEQDEEENMYEEGQFDEEEEQEKVTVKKQRKSGGKGLRMADLAHQSSNLPNQLEAPRTLSPSKKKSQLSSIASSGISDRRRWTESEQAMLKEGVRLFGRGKWKLILQHYNFNNRTEVNLKDKWRNLVNFGHVTFDGYDDEE